MQRVVYYLTDCYPNYRFQEKGQRFLMRSSSNSESIDKIARRREAGREDRTKKERKKEMDASIAIFGEKACIPPRLLGRIRGRRLSAIISDCSRVFVPREFRNNEATRGNFAVHSLFPSFSFHRARMLVDNNALPVEKR